MTQARANNNSISDIDFRSAAVAGVMPVPTNSPTSAAFPTSDLRALVDAHFDGRTEQPSPALSVLPLPSLDAGGVAETPTKPTQRLRQSHFTEHRRAVKRDVKSGNSPEPTGEGDTLQSDRSSKSWANPETRSKRLKKYYSETLWKLQAFHDEFGVKDAYGHRLKGVKNPYANTAYFTLTVPHRRGHNHNHLKAVERAWTRFYDALKHKQQRDSGRLECVKFVGLHTDGLNPHLHVIAVSDRPLDREWIYDEWHRLTKATEIDFSETFMRFRDLRHVVWYCCQNLDYAHGPTRKRISRSRYFTKKRDTIAETETQDMGGSAAKLAEMIEKHFNKSPPRSYEENPLDLDIETFWDECQGNPPPPAA